MGISGASFHTSGVLVSSALIEPSSSGSRSCCGGLDAALVEKALYSRSPFREAFGAIGLLLGMIMLHREDPADFWIQNFLVL